MKTKDPIDTNKTPTFEVTEQTRVFGLDEVKASEDDDLPLIRLLKYHQAGGLSAERAAEYLKELEENRRL